MSSAPFGNDPAKIERYKSFWRRADATRSLVGFTTRGWFPLEEYAATRAWPVNSYLTPEMVVPEAFLEDEERLLEEGEVLDDDIIRGDMPAAAAIPWLSGMLGSRLRILPGNVLGEDRSASWDEMEALRLDRAHPWFRKYLEFAEGTTIFSAEEALAAFEDGNDTTSLPYTAALINPFLVESGFTEAEASLEGLFDASFTADYVERKGE